MRVYEGAGLAGGGRFICIGPLEVVGVMGSADFNRFASALSSTATSSRGRLAAAPCMATPPLVGEGAAALAPAAAAAAVVKQR